jgi:uncharacterized protein YutE (UPF0331/DUF86 family)
MVDQTRLDRMLSNLRGYVATLKEMGQIPEVEFLANADKIGNAKYHFVIAIECAIDIANHIIASQDFRFPHDSADSFEVLVDEHILDESMRKPLCAMARFRNRLVHVYWDIDDVLVYEFLGESLRDLGHFVGVVSGHRW